MEEYGNFYKVMSKVGDTYQEMFGEDSWLSGENGRDMLWNPTSKTFEWTGEPSFLLGGKHYIYIMNSEYKGGNEQNNPYYEFAPLDIFEYLRHLLLNPRLFFRNDLW